MEAISNKKEAIIKFIIVFGVYLCYTQFFSVIFNSFGITGITVNFIADLIFFIGIIYLYKDSLIESLKDFKTKFKFSKILIYVLCGVIGIFLVTILSGMIGELICPGQDITDDNTNAIYGIGDKAYVIFKTAIFASIAEVLVYIKSVKDVVNNSRHNILFIAISALIYGLMNVAYSNLDLVAVAAFISYFLVCVVLAFIYTKTDNIILIMLIKFIYSLIPLTILLTGVGA